jgi:hypothetical protein
MRLAGLVVMTVVLSAGCDRQKPRAPALGDEPVYSNSRDGFSFLAPEGWAQWSKSDAPPEASDKDRVLVSYVSPSEKATEFEVSRADLPESVDLPARLALPSHNSGSSWQPAGVAEATKVGGKDATRYTFACKDRVKESTVVRHGGHVYFFTVISPKSDETERRQIRALIAEVRWTS